MEHEAALRAEPALQLVQLARPAVEAILRWRREGAGFIALRCRTAEPATSAGVLGIGTPDEPGEQRGVVGVLGGIGEVHPEQAAQFGR